MKVNLSLDLAGLEFDIRCLKVKGCWERRFGSLNGLIIPERGMRAKISLKVQRGGDVWLGLLNEGLVGPKTLS